LAEVRLQIERTFGVGEPVFRDLAERSHHFAHLLRIAAFGAVLLVRLEIGRHGFAARLDHAGEVLRKLLDVEGATLAWVRRGSHVGASICRPAVCLTHRPAHTKSCKTRAIASIDEPCRPIMLGHISGIKLVSRNRSNWRRFHDPGAPSRARWAALAFMT